MIKLNEKLDTVAEILANSLHELNPQRSVAEWKKHVIENHQNPQKFFEGNGEGAQEYLSFVNVYNKDKKNREKNIKRR